MPFPDPSLAPPSLQPWQLSYGGLTFGGIVPAAAYQLQSIDYSPPAVLSGDAQRPLDQGEFAGLDVLPGRDTVLTQVVISDGISLDHSRQVLGSVLGVGAVEQPLYLRLPTGLYACMARPRKHQYTADITTVFGKGTVVSSMLHSTDPRWYAAPSKQASVGLPGPLGGLTFPATFPASFGGGGAGGILQVLNSGLFEMRPIFIVLGPCTNPTIQNLSLPGAPALGFNLMLGAGDTLAIDTDFQSIVYTVGGSTIGSSRRNALTATSTWFNFPPGLSQIEFTTTDSAQAGRLTVQWADAYVAL